MTDTSIYQNPLCERYASAAMLQNFSSDRRYQTWRRLWVALAEVEAELGLEISREQIEELRRHQDDIPYARVAALEEELRHDVMAHIHAYGEQCPRARGIIHLGATSCYVTDNADLILMRDGLAILAEKLAALLLALKNFALEHADRPALAYTHFQPAQLTTVGKRAAMWAQDFLIDFQEISRVRSELRFRGAKGATGTQASFMKLFNGEGGKVKDLDRRVAERMGFKDSFRITGQTYTRKLDAQALQAVAGVAVSAHKFSNDLRLLQGLGELEEPFGKAQVGSSAMPYKRNPMKLERISSLAKWGICESQNAAWIGATQWFERTLDDSANRRLSIPQTFLAVDAILVLANHVMRGLVVYPEVIRRRVREELPFMAVENLLLLAVRRGGDRQNLHERLRVHSMEVQEARRSGIAGKGLVERLQDDPAFAAVREQLDAVLDPAQYYGRAPEQVKEFFAEEVDPVLSGYNRLAGLKWDVKV
ncbi:MAG: adenylosuccinate lyase [Planctomycetes bacterium]|nr:adenylosuccinate lyase [Planctomycetota bacterium]